MLKNLVILHGWQSSKEKWQSVKELIEKTGIKVFNPDIPGFKQETKLDKAWTLDSYLEWFDEYVKNHPELINGFFLLGHSFGGRMTIKISSQGKYNLNGIILVSAAGIKSKPAVYKKILFFFAQLIRVLKIEEIPLISGVYIFLRKLFYRYILRKTDYLQATGFLKDTIKNVLTEDLTLLLEKISTPTLIIWGKKDKITPLKDAFLMKEKIKDSKIELIDSADHAVHLQEPERLAELIINFIK